MDSWKLLAIGFALQLKPNNAREAIEWAEEIQEWLCDDEDMEVTFTPEGTIH